jgi:hypothetical protein
MSARLQAFERFQDKKKCKNNYGLVLKILRKKWRQAGAAPGWISSQNIANTERTSQ